MSNLRQNFLIFVMCFPCIALADSTHDYFTVEESVALMDTDKNGFADVMEVRAYLEKIHGSDYKKAELDFLVSTASGKSCSTPFAQRLYGDK